MKSLIVRFVREEAGQDLIEYALIATFVSLVAAAGATAARRRRLTAGTPPWARASTTSRRP